MEKSLQTILQESISEAEQRSKMKYKTQDDDYTRCFNLGVSTMSAFLTAVLIDKGLLDFSYAKGVKYDNS